MTDPTPPHRPPLQDTWNSRDLPVLIEVAEAADDFRPVRPTTISRATGLSEKSVLAAIQALVAGGFLHEDKEEVSRSSVGEIYLTFAGWLIPSASGRRAVGQWPDEAAALERMIKQLERIANNDAADDESRGRARRVLNELSGAGRDLALSVASAVLVGTFI